MKFLPILLLLSLLPHCLVAQTAAKSAAASKAEFMAAGENLMTKLEEFNAALDTAKDATTAEAAKPKLAKLIKEIEALNKATAALGEAPPAIKVELDENPKMRARAQAILMKMVPLTQRIAADPVLLPILQQTMRDFQRASSGGAAPEPTAPPKAAPVKPPGK